MILKGFCHFEISGKDDFLHELHFKNSILEETLVELFVHVSNVL